MYILPLLRTFIHCTIYIKWIRQYINISLKFLNIKRKETKKKNIKQQFYTYTPFIQITLTVADFVINNDLKKFKLCSSLSSPKRRRKKKS